MMKCNAYKPMRQYFKKISLKRDRLACRGSKNSLVTPKPEMMVYLLLMRITGTIISSSETPPC
jgi:hypothetical protein